MPTDVLDGKAPLEVWEDKKLGNLLHMREWGALAVKHVEAQFWSNKLAARAKKLHLVGYNTKNKTYRLWDLAEPLKITNSAEVFFREKETRDVVPPKAEYDPFPEPGWIICQPCSTETKEEEYDDDDDNDDHDHDNDSIPGAETRLAPERPAEEGAGCAESTYTDGGNV